MPSILLEIAKNLQAKISYEIDGRSNDDERWLIGVGRVMVGPDKDINITRVLSLDFLGGLEEAIAQHLEWQES